MGDDAETVGLVILGGLALGALLVLLGLKKPDCPVCHRPINRGTNACPHCWAVLRWE